MVVTLLWCNVCYGKMLIFLIKRSSSPWYNESNTALCENSVGLCSLLLTLCSIILIIATLPLSLIFTVKVTQVTMETQWPTQGSAIVNSLIAYKNKILSLFNSCSMAWCLLTLWYVLSTVGKLNIILELISLKGSQCQPMLVTFVLIWMQSKGAQVSTI